MKPNCEVDINPPRINKVDQQQFDKKLPVLHDSHTFGHKRNGELRGFNIDMLKAGINACDPKSYFCIEDPTLQDELLSCENPEEIFLEKERQEIKERLYNTLSSEAKQIISIVLNTPSEMMSVIASPRTKKISKDRIATMLRKQWGERKSVSQIMNEIKNYVEAF